MKLPEMRNFMSEMHLSLQVLTSRKDRHCRRKRPVNLKTQQQKLSKLKHRAGKRLKKLKSFNDLNDNIKHFHILGRLGGNSEKNMWRNLG